MTSPSAWRLVPVEPSTAMLSAGQVAWLADPMRRSSTLYAAMLAAAPEPPAAEPIGWQWRFANETVWHTACKPEYADPEAHAREMVGSYGEVRPIYTAAVWNRRATDARMTER